MGLIPGKYLVVRAVYRLPDDWDGTIPDAIREMARHDESTRNNAEQSKFDFPVEWIDTSEDFSHFERYQQHTNGNGKLLSAFGCHAWNGSDWAGNIQRRLPVDEQPKD